MTFFSAILVVGVSLLAIPTGALAAQAPVPQLEHLSYREWSQMTEDTKREIFWKLTPERKAFLVRSHIVEWRRLHRENLSTRQLELITEALQMVKPELYGRAVNADTKRRFSEFLITAQAAFLPEQIAELFFFGGK